MTKALRSFFFVHYFLYPPSTWAGITFLANIGGATKLGRRILTLNLQHLDHPALRVIRVY